jgi:hypothetical protein
MSVRSLASELVRGCLSTIKGSQCPWRGLLFMFLNFYFIQCLYVDTFIYPMFPWLQPLFHSHSCFSPGNPINSKHQNGKFKIERFSDTICHFYVSRYYDSLVFDQRLSVAPFPFNFVFGFHSSADPRTKRKDEDGDTGVWRGVYKGVEDGHRLPALWACHP